MGDDPDFLMNNGFTQHDLEIATKLSRIEQKVDTLVMEGSKWKDEVDKTLKEHTGLFKKASGVFTVIQVAWLAIVAYFNGHNK